MKKKYERPRIEVAEFQFSKHIAASSCYWGGNDQYTHAYVGCKDNFTPGTGGWINDTGP